MKQLLKICLIFFMSHQVFGLQTIPSFDISKIEKMPKSEKAIRATKKFSGTISSAIDTLNQINSIKLDSATIDSLSIAYQDKAIIELEQYLTEKSGDGLDNPIISNPINEELKKIREKSIQKEFPLDKLKLEQAKEEIDKAKTKYIELPDSRIKEIGVKRNSLAKYNTIDRMEYGLIGGITGSSFFPNEVQGQLGYRISIHSVLGIGMVFHPENQIRLNAIKAFTNFRIKGPFFIQAEIIQSLNSDSNLASIENPKAIKFRTGIGTDFSISNFIHLRVSILSKIGKSEMIQSNFRNSLLINLGIILYKRTPASIK